MMGGPAVVFVCEHGSGKSLIASQWFNRLARERGLAVQAVPRGLAPEAAPPRIAAQLTRDGFDVAGFQPRELAPADLAGASRLVMIGSDPPAWTASAGVAVDRWTGIPPASESYEASRDAMLQRIAALLDSLGPGAPP
jgi:protein-tyrosine-phosphatase